MSRWSVSLVCLLAGAVAGGLIAERALQGQNPTPVAIPKELTSYRDIVKKVLPAVVSIEAKAKPKVKKMNQPRQQRQRQEFDDSQVPEEFRKFFQDFGVSPNFQNNADDSPPQLGFGSGFLIDPKGVILTNFHVVEGAEQVEVQLGDGRKFTSKDIKGDRKTDLAIVRIESKEALPYLEMGDSDEMEIGDRVLAVGAPFGLTGSVTHGIISAKGRNGLRMNFYEDFLQTDAPINPGNSGGPLVSLDGKVVGINSAIKSRSGGFQGVGLAIASNLAKNIKQQLMDNGAVRRGFLGVQIKDLDPEVATRLGVKEQKGVVVGQVFDGSPAAKAGIKAGDVLTSLNGKPVKDGRELQIVVAGLPLGKPIDIAVVRDGKAQTLKVTIEEQPDDFGAARVPTPSSPRREQDAISMDKVGVEVADLTPKLAGQMGYKENAEGVVITQVEPDSPAGLAGLQRGMTIAKVDKQPVMSAADFRESMDKASLANGVLLQVQSPRGGTDYVMLKAVEEKQ